MIPSALRLWSQLDLVTAQWDHNTHSLTDEQMDDLKRYHGFPKSHELLSKEAESLKDKYVWHLNLMAMLYPLTSSCLVREVLIKPEVFIWQDAKSGHDLRERMEVQWWGRTLHLPSWSPRAPVFYFPQPSVPFASASSGPGPSPRIWLCPWLCFPVQTYSIQLMQHPKEFLMRF